MKHLQLAERVQQSEAETVAAWWVESGLKHTAAQRYVVVEQEADLDAFVEIEKHLQVGHQMLVFEAILERKVDLHCQYVLVQENYRL